MYESIVLAVCGLLLLFFLIKEKFVITAVLFLNDKNIIATVENSAGETMDFIGPEPEWKSVDGDMKPPKRLEKMLDNTYLAWKETHDRGTKD